MRADFENKQKTLKVASLLKLVLFCIRVRDWKQPLRSDRV